MNNSKNRIFLFYKINYYNNNVWHAMCAHISIVKMNTYNYSCSTALEYSNMDSRFIGDVING